MPLNARKTVMNINNERQRGWRPVTALKNLNTLFSRVF
jgi:hypothetical protein